MLPPQNIIVVPYNPKWPEYFREEALHLQKNLGEDIAKEIHHIGSTAIPNMPAKPVIDILVECDDISLIEIIKIKLQPLGYTKISGHIVPHHSYFTKRYDAAEDITYHLHLRERGDAQVKRNINFRDYLIHHPTDAKAYAALKLKLAKLYKEDRLSYVYGKDELVQAIDAKAKLWSKRRKEFLPQNRGPEFKLWTKERIIKAAETNFNIHFTHFAQYIPTIELVRKAEFTLVNCNLADEAFNVVLQANFTSENAITTINLITKYFVEKKVPFTWWLCPYDQPQNLMVLLTQQNFYNIGNHDLMYLDLDDFDIAKVTIPAELTIRPVVNKNMFTEYAKILPTTKDSSAKYFSQLAAIATSEDPFEYFVGYVNDKPVVRGMICYFAGVAGFYDLATSLKYRNKGYTAVMENFLLQRSKDLGYHVAIFQAEDFKKTDEKHNNNGLIMLAR